MKSYTTYIFDLDGTITNTMDVWLGIFRDGFIQFGFAVPDDKTLGQYTHDWGTLAQVGFTKEQINAFGHFAMRAANQRLATAPFHEGIVDTLTELKSKGHNIAIFSAMHRNVFAPVIEHRQLHQFTDVTIAGSDVSRLKPHPDGIFKALKDLGVGEANYQNAVYIGDKDTDIQAATNAGIDSILYYPPAHQMMYDLQELQQYKPTHVITSWQELLV